MKVRTRIAVNAKRVKRRHNPLKIDPTRTASLRRRFIARVKRQFALLRGRIIKLVVDEDAFGLRKSPTTFAQLVKHPKLPKLEINAFCPTGPEQRRLLSESSTLAANVKDWAFQSTPDKIKSFQAWLRTQVAQTLRNQTEESLWRAYVEQGFRQGAGRSFDDVRQSELRRRRPELFTEQHQAGVRDFYAGTREEFLRSAFGRPETIEKVRLLAGRSFDDLEGISNDMSTRMSRTLTDGLVRGQGPRDIARALTREVDLGSARAEMIARTEIIRAHAEGQLDAMESLGVEDVGVAVEWQTANDDAVCELCSELEGVVLKIDEAKGMLPRHPRCRCAWLPANVGEGDKDRIDTKRSIQGAIRASQRLAGDPEGVSWGPAEEISRERPRSTLNTDLAGAPPHPLIAEFNRLMTNWCNRYGGDTCKGDGT